MRSLQLRPDSFTLALLVTVVAASLLPARGATENALKHVTDLSIGLLFFMHGAKLSRQALVSGASQTRLHLSILASTFLLFPALGFLLGPLLTPLLGPELYQGMIYLCALPSTVQSSIALVSMARGNIAAAICAAAASSLLGVFVTPALVAVTMDTRGSGGSVLEAMGDITVQLLLPFLAGQVARTWIGGFVARNRAWLKYLDQGSILLIVYGAFGKAVVEGLWQRVAPIALLSLALSCLLLLGLVLFATSTLGKALGFNREDRITLLFCGSKKSLATGVPMAQVLFAGNAMGPLLLPLMLFHQIQLFVCAALAQRYGRQKPSPEEA